jgi:hypothetical protein
MCRSFCLICGLLALLVVAMAACGQTTQPTTAPTTAPAAGNWVDFTGASGYRLKFPDSLRRMAVNQPGVELVLIRPEMDPGGTQAQVLVVAPPNLKAGGHLDDAATAYVENFKRAMSDARVLETTDTTLGGDRAKAYVIQGHQVQGGRDTKARLVIAVRNDQLYSVVEMAEPAGYESIDAVFEKMLESFQWMK